jgi:hypothetical protein
MTKRERVEDLGKLSIMLKDVLDHSIFENTDSKHCFETWKVETHDKEEYGYERGLDHIFSCIRCVRDQLEECLNLAYGDDNEN